MNDIDSNVNVTLLSQKHDYSLIRYKKPWIVVFLRLRTQFFCMQLVNLFQTPEAYSEPCQTSKIGFLQK